MIKKLTAIGNSLGVVIDRPILDLLDITKSYTIKFPAADVNNNTTAGPARHFYSVTVYR